MHRVTRIAFHGILVSLLFVALTGCAPAPTEGCSSDVDCKGDRICTNKVCVDPNASKEQGGTEKSAEASGTEPPPTIPDEPSTSPVDASPEAPTPDHPTESFWPDRPAPDTAKPDTTAPDTPAPDTTAPDTPAPDTTAPDTPAPDTTAPDTPAPDTTSPDLAPGCPDGTTRSCYTGAAGTQGKGECKAGTETCNAGVWGACTGEVVPASEACGDQKDNDCDGQIDEKCGACSPNGKTEPCYNGPNNTQNQGECRAGVRTCTAGQWSTCVGEIVPTSETCNDKDDDCDGKVDETISRPCYSGPSGTDGKGVCKKGQQFCASGLWTNCTGEVIPTSEACNGKDDDCDGSIDENLNSGAACTITGAKGICAAGKQACTNGAISCQALNQATTEICNNLDDDCDGSVDENLPCTPTCLQFSTKGIDFGALPTSCTSTRQSVSMTNRCTTNINVQAAGMTGSTGPEFILYTTVTTPFTLNVGTTRTFELGFKPTQIKSYTGEFRMVLNGGAYSQIALKGQGLSAAGTTETFITPSASKVDLLFVMDDSCSMSQHQQNLGQAFPAFYARAIQYNSDFQIGVITTDASKLGHLQGTVKIITPQTPNASTVFQNNIAVGVTGSPQEKGLETARLALSPPAITNQNKGFLRADAILSLVFVSDEPDQSTPTTVASYIQFFRSLKGTNANRLLRASVLGPYPNTDPRCNTAGACRYREVMQALGGIYEYIRTTSVTSLRTYLEKLADFTLGQQSLYKLSGHPDSTSIAVKVNGTTVAKSTTNGWQYEASSNSVRFLGTAVPKSGDTVAISYKPTCSPTP